MKLLSNGNSYIGLFGSILTGTGEIVTTPHISLVAKKTNFDITKIEGDIFKIDTSPTYGLELGEEITLVQSAFNIEAIVVEVGNDDMYRIIRRFDQQSSFEDEEDLIPDGTIEAFRESDVLTLVSLADGAYYTKYGELLVVKNAFYHLGSISLDQVYGRKPILRGRAVIKWQLAGLLRTAYDDVMNDLENYQVDEYDKFAYVDTGKITELIVFRTIANYEDTLPESEDIEKTFAVKYKSKITGFSPKKKIVDDEVVVTKKKGLQY